MKNDKYYKIAKVILGCVLMVLLYLFALNGRYMRYEPFVYDKWTGKTFNVLFKLAPEEAKKLWSQPATKQRRFG